MTSFIESGLENPTTTPNSEHQPQSRHEIHFPHEDIEQE